MSFVICYLSSAYMYLSGFSIISPYSAVRSMVVIFALSSAYRNPYFSLIAFSNAIRPFMKSALKAASASGFPHLLFFLPYPVLLFFERCHLAFQGLCLHSGISFKNQLSSFSYHFVTCCSLSLGRLFSPDVPYFVLIAEELLKAFLRHS